MINAVVGLVGATAPVEIITEKPTGDIKAFKKSLHKKVLNNHEFF
jgi:hypothetical protein